LDICGKVFLGLSSWLMNVLATLHFLGQASSGLLELKAVKSGSYSNVSQDQAGREELLYL
jgi:hypothetical protein